MARWRDGCPQAAEELYHRFGRHILTVLRWHMNSKCRRHFDSSDVAQSVWESFFNRTVVTGEFRTADDLRRFLMRVARNKLQEVQRPRQDPFWQPVAVGSASHLEPAGRSPTPSQEAVVQEYRERMLADQPPRSRRIVEMICAGCSYEEIATETGASVRSIKRVIRQALRKGRLLK